MDLTFVLFLLFLSNASCFIISKALSTSRGRIVKCNAKPLLHTFSPQSPLRCEIVSAKRIAHNDADADTYNIQIRHFGELKFLEGQHVGVIVPGREQ